MASEASERCDLVGTPAYWAPELIRGVPASVASDLYAFGLVAYQLLSGEPLSSLTAPDALDRSPGLTAASWLAAYEHPPSRDFPTRSGCAKRCIALRFSAGTARCSGGGLFRGVPDKASDG